MLNLLYCKQHFVVIAAACCAASKQASKQASNQEHAYKKLNIYKRGVNGYVNKNLEYNYKHNNY